MIKIQSPTRVDLAGGTLDCWPLFLLVGRCRTINISIDIMTSVELETLDDSQVIAEITDLNFSKSYSNLQEFLSCDDPEISLVKSVVEYWRPQTGFRVRTASDSPVGGGLGGSSSLTISLMKAFSQMCSKTLTVDEMVKVAHNMEAKVLNTPTGTQDYFPAAQPGLNTINYDVEGPQLEPLEFDEEFFNKHMTLVYTGRAHHSGINNWQVIKSVVEGDNHTLGTLKKISRIADEFYDALKTKNWTVIPDLFRSEYEARIELCESFTSPEIEELQKITIENGGEALKICGAGGGGCVMVWARPEKKADIVKVCIDRGFQVLNIKAVKG